METIQNQLKAFPLGLGTWELCGFFNGGIDEREAISTIHQAFDRGIRLIDTAPLYGFGRAEEIVGRAIRQYGRRDQILIATKFGLSWQDRKLFRDARKQTIRKEIESSLRRLQLDAIDLYQLHWPDPLTPVAETAETLRDLLKEGKIRGVGLSNFTLEEMKEFQKHLPVQAVQPAYNLFEREIDRGLFDDCTQQGIPVLGFSALCRGLLGGNLNQDARFRSDDLRSFDPKFKEPRYSQYLQCADILKKWADQRFGRSLPELAVRWVLDRGAIPIWGPSQTSHLFDLTTLNSWNLKPRDFQEIDRIVESTILDPVGLEFLAPPTR